MIRLEFLGPHLKTELADLFYGGTNFLRYLMRQRSISQLLGHRLPLIQHPIQEVQNDLLRAGVFGLRRDQEPSESGDRISILTGCVGDGDTEIGGHALNRRSSSGDSFEAAFYKFSRSIFHAAIGNVVLHGINQLDITDGAFTLPHHTGDTLTALCAQAYRPLGCSTLAGSAVPLWTNFGEIVCKTIGGPATLGAMHSENS